METVFFWRSEIRRKKKLNRELFTASCHPGVWSAQTRSICRIQLLKASKDPRAGVRKYSIGREPSRSGTMYWIMHRSFAPEESKSGLKIIFSYSILKVSSCSMAWRHPGGIIIISPLCTRCLSKSTETKPCPLLMTTSSNSSCQCSGTPGKSRGIEQR